MQVHRIWIHNEETLAMIFCTFPFSHYLFFESESTMNFICDLLISFSFQARSILLIARGGRKCTPETGFWNPLIFPGKMELYWKGLYQQRSGWELICLALQLSFVHFLFLSRIIYFSNLKSQWRNFSFLFLSCIIYSSYRQGWQIMYPRNRIL